MNRKCILIILSALLNPFLKAQPDSLPRLNNRSNFLDGYVLISEKDTLFGKIDNKGYYNNSQFCDFKDNKTNSIRRFTPAEIYGYRFVNHGKYYLSKTAVIQNKTTRLFLEYLIHGKLDIYFYQDRDRFNHYYASKDTVDLYELKYKESTKVVMGTRYFYQTKHHQQLLNNLTLDCPDLKNSILQLKEPNHRNLIKIAEKYHNLSCLDENCIIYEKKIPHKIKFNIVGGPTYHFLDILEREHQLSPSYGFNVLFQQSQKHENLFLGLGFYSHGKFDSIGSFYRIPLSLNYLNPKKGFSPVFAYEFDLNSMGLTGAFKPGVKYQINKVAILLIADINAVYFVRPYAVSLNLGIMFDLN